MWEMKRLSTSHLKNQAPPNKFPFPKVFKGKNMSKKAPSLSDFIHEVQAEESVQSFKPPHVEKVIEKKIPATTVIKAAPKVKTKRPSKVVASKALKSIKAEEKETYKKLSVTLPEELHRFLVDTSYARRRSGEPYQLSQLVREAVENWRNANG